MERNRQSKWDKANIRTVSTKLSPEEMRVFDEKCGAKAVTKYTMTKLLIQRFIHGSC